MCFNSSLSDVSSSLVWKSLGHLTSGQSCSIPNNANEIAVRALHPGTTVYSYKEFCVPLLPNEETSCIIDSRYNSATPSASFDIKVIISKTSVKESNGGSLDVYYR